MYIECIIENH